MLLWFYIGSRCSLLYSVVWNLAEWRPVLCAASGGHFRSHVNAMANTALVRAADRALTPSLLRNVTPLIRVTLGPGLSTTFCFVLEKPLYLSQAMHRSDSATGSVAKSVLHTVAAKIATRVLAREGSSTSTGCPRRFA